MWRLLSIKLLGTFLFPRILSCNDVCFFQTDIMSPFHKNPYKMTNSPPTTPSRPCLVRCPSLKNYILVNTNLVISPQIIESILFF